MNKTAINTELNDGFVINSDTGEILYSIDDVIDKSQENYFLDDNDEVTVKDDAPYTFEFKGQVITDPFMDESGRFEVEPAEYYGEAFLNSCFCSKINTASKLYIVDYESIYDDLKDSDITLEEIKAVPERELTNMVHKADECAADEVTEYFKDEYYDMDEDELADEVINSDAYKIAYRTALYNFIKAYHNNEHTAGKHPFDYRLQERELLKGTDITDEQLYSIPDDQLTILFGSAFQQAFDEIADKLIEDNDDDFDDCEFESAVESSPEYEELCRKNFYDEVKLYLDTH